MYKSIKMFIVKFGLLFFYIISNNSIYAKRTEVIFTCANDTKCDELTENDISEEALSTTTENVYNATSSSINNLIYSVQTTKIQTIVTTHAPYTIKHNNEMRNSNIQKMHSDICVCDLTISSCDINCCCDKDCNDFQLTVFSHCENYQAEFFDKRYCYNRNFILRNNTPFILEQLTNNLFCILYDNLPPTYSIDSELDIKTEKDLRGAISPDRLKWKWKNQIGVPAFNVSNPYQDDDIIWIVHHNFIQPFEILQSGFTELCSFKKTVKYLREWNNKCLQTELSETNPFLFPTLFNNFSVIASPHFLNETHIEALQQVCPRNVCLTLTNYFCKDSWKKCSNNTISGSCTNGTCYYVVKGVKYVIIHNGSMGIYSVDIYFNMGNTSKSFYQQFQVIYEWAELDKEKRFSLSGNPGYIIGKPLVIGVLKLNKINNIESKYVYFNKTNRFLTLPIAAKGGECNEIDRYTVAFGEDIKLKCFVSVNTSNFSTESCIELQNLTTHFLMRETLFNVTEADQYNIYVSKLGNISNNDTTNWAQILLNRIPQSVISGESVDNRIYCSGLITSMHLNILYSVLTKPETLSNHKVLGVGITFSAESNISWSKCLSENCTDKLKLDVVSYVTFYDVSKPSKYYFVGGHNLDLTLPYDFFYPFLSSSACIESCTFLIILGLSVILPNFIYLI